MVLWISSAFSVVFWLSSAFSMASGVLFDMFLSVKQIMQHSLLQFKKLYSQPTKNTVNLK